MTKYIEYFQVEAKCLLKDFKKNLPEAKSRCEKYFNGRDSLSLMNAQHVVAKEYGFESWNDLIKQESHKLAEALIIAKNKTLKNNFYSWNGELTSNLDRGINQPLTKPENRDINMKTFTRKGSDFFTIEHMDVSEYNLSGLNPLKVRYAEDTKWPEDPSMLPQGFNPKEFLESRKNPGLGIKELHKKGIKGKGISIAVINCYELTAHIEYYNSLKEYEKIEFSDNNSILSSTDSILTAIAGKTCGIVPQADIYYYTVNNEKNTTCKNYVVAIKKICELHKKNISAGKSGIDATLITGGLYSNIKDIDDVNVALEEAKKLGILCYTKFVDLLENTNIRLGHIYCKLDGNVDNPDDYIPLRNPNSKWKLFDGYRNILCFPCGAKTVSLREKMNGYAFEHYSNSYAPIYAIGLYLLAKSVKETITPYEFFELGLKTGEFRKGVGTIINPVKLIESLK